MATEQKTNLKEVPDAPDSDAILRVRGLEVHFDTDEGPLVAVNGVDLEIRAGEILGIVGESGCGKSVLSETLLRLIPSPPGEIVAGEILFRSEKQGWVDIAKLRPDSQKMRSIRGNEISMIFQEPMTSLSPVYTVGNQIMEAIRLHQGLGKEEVRELAISMLREARIPVPEQRVDDYPHHMSGGMRQRVMIAMALACQPQILIADEPTTALDVTVQAQILNLIKDLQQRRHMTVLLITHDLGVMAETAERVAVMYLGRIVELAAVGDLFAHPAHPYTRGLLECIPDLATERERLYSIPGRVPVPIGVKPGCPFAPRCPEALPECRKEMPPWTPVGEGHQVACWRCSETPWVKV